MRILHIDLDAFFASCERLRLDDPAAVVVCIRSGRGDDGGAVSTADYAARDLGIDSGIPIVRAKELAAEAEREVTFVDADHGFYREVSERVMDRVMERADAVQVASIDEAYARLPGDYGEAARTARELRAEIREEEGVTASAGVGPNKLVAKIASDRDKPDGQTVVRPGEVADFLGPLPVDELHGVGPKTADTLAERFDVETVADLRTVEAQRLVRAFGETRGVSLHAKARGEGSAELEEQDRKQLSRLTTLEADTREMADLRPVVRDLAGEVMDRLERRDWRYSTVTAVVVTGARDTRSRSRSFKTPIADRERFYRTAEDLLAGFLGEHPEVEVRRVGVRAAGLEKSGQRRLDDY